ncbi:hypothetical protein [Arthrobacter sp. L77]|nr:hypothetical protein [Arthrobacter sp. L77]
MKQQASLQDYIDRMVAAAPPLNDEQAAKIAALLRAGGDGQHG